MELEQNTAYLLLGSNLGDSKKILSDAILLINTEVGKVFAQSSFYETAAWGKTDQPDFINIALGIETKLTAKELLLSVLTIEERLGRVRFEKWGARLIDIDVIFYNQEVVDDEDLKLPHPEMQNRKFVMVPMAEIAPDFPHPLLKKNMSEILLTLNDTLAVSKT